MAKRMEFLVRETGHQDLWIEIEHGDWRARIDGYWEDVGYRQMFLELTPRTLRALREQFVPAGVGVPGGEPVPLGGDRDEGLLNLNVLLSSSRRYENYRWADEGDVEIQEPEESKYRYKWYFNKIRLYHKGKAVTGIVKGKTEIPHYDILKPLPKGVKGVPSGLVAELKELWDKNGGDLESDYDSGRGPWFHVDEADSVLLEPSSQHFSDPLDGVAEAIAQSEGEAVSQESWPLMLKMEFGWDGFGEKVQRNKAETKRLMRTAAELIKRAADVAAREVDVIEVFVFVGISGVEKPVESITFDPDACREGTGKWWSIDEAIARFLDPSRMECLRQFDGWSFCDEHCLTYVALGVRSYLPFVATHWGRRVSAALRHISHSDVWVGGVTVTEVGLNGFRRQGYLGKELDEAIVGSFQQDASMEYFMRHKEAYPRINEDGLDQMFSAVEHSAIQTLALLANSWNALARRNILSDTAYDWAMEEVVLRTPLSDEEKRQQVEKGKKLQIDDIENILKSLEE